MTSSSQNTTLLPDQTPEPDETTLSDVTPPVLDGNKVPVETDVPVVDPKSKDSNRPGETVDALTSVSKRSIKKQLKRERILQKQHEWKLKRKLKRKEKKTRKKVSNLSIEKPKINSMSGSKSKYTVVLDFSYNDLMSEKDLMKCGHQVVRCYSANRRAPDPLQLHFCSFGGKMKDEISKNDGHQNWDVYFHENSYLEVFEKSQLVYLTSESRNVLESLDENKVYIIGGLVDHNFQKGISYKKAVKEGIAHAQLPIKQHVQMKARSVLAVNHVFEIILKVASGESWTKTFLSVIPPRNFKNYIGEKLLAEKYSSDGFTRKNSEENTTDNEEGKSSENVTSIPEVSEKQNVGEQMEIS